MATIISSHAHSSSLRIYEKSWRITPNKLSSFGVSVSRHHCGGILSSDGRSSVSSLEKSSKENSVLVRAVSDGQHTDDDQDDDQDQQPPIESSKLNSSREQLERLVGPDDSRFSGIDLATLIRKKYGRSYDVQLIRKEFLGRSLLAMNVMWKYREQRSFPLTEEEYILRLDDIANTLKCWGAVSHVRNSLEKLKERPRIGKAVSIFIDMDESGDRSNEWIYK